jgi:hypothetical protein
MTDPATQEKFVQLETELLALRREMASLRATHSPARRRPRRRSLRLVGATLLAVMLATIPFGLFAASFVDLNPGSGHNANINAIADAGISKGCSDNTHYCPNDFVTREQMASFLARTAGLGANKPVTNAARLAVANPAVGGPTFAANDLLRVAVAGLVEENQISFTLTNNNFQSLLSLNLTAPQAGYVLVNSSVMAYTEASSGCPCDTGTRIRHDTGNVVLFSANETIQNAPSGFNEGSMSQTWVFAVTAGANTFSLEGSRFIGTGAIVFSRPRLTALFVPFDGQGNTP